MDKTKSVWSARPSTTQIAVTFTILVLGLGSLLLAGIIENAPKQAYQMIGGAQGLITIWVLLTNVRK